MILRKKNARRPWEPEEEKQLREMAEAGKTITIISLKLKRTVTAVRDRLGILKVSLHKVGRRPKENPSSVSGGPNRDRAQADCAAPAKPGCLLYRLRSGRVGRVGNGPFLKDLWPFRRLAPFPRGD